MQEIAVGTVAGTGAAINVSLGFIPRYVKVYNNDDAGGLAPKIEWWQGMAAASGVKTLKSVDNGVTGNASSSKVTTGGISEYAGSASAPKGFTIGTDGDINVSAENIYYVAVR